MDWPAHHTPGPGIESPVAMSMAAPPDTRSRARTDAPQGSGGIGRIPILVPAEPSGDPFMVSNTTH